MSTQLEVRDGAGRFLAGKSGNPAGRPKEEFSLSSLLRAAIDKVHPVEAKLAADAKREPRKNGELLVEKLYGKVLAGDLKAIQMVLDRLEGRPRSTVDVSGTVEHDHQHNASSEVVEVLFQRLLTLRRQASLPAPEIVDAEIVA